MTPENSLQLLTDEDVIAYLRLDVIETPDGTRKSADPRERLRNLRRTRRIGYVRLPGGIRYRLSDVQRFIEDSSVEAD